VRHVRILIPCITVVFCVTMSFAQTTAQTPVNVPNVPQQQPAQATPEAVAPPRVDPPSMAMSLEELETTGDKLRERNMYRDAIDYYETALKKSGKNAVLWNKRAIAELQLGKLREAEKSLKKAVKHDKTYADAVNNLGVVYYQMESAKALRNPDGKRDFGRAIKWYRRALKLRETSASFHSNLGTAYFSDGQIDKAAVEYARAFQLDPEVFERRTRAGVAATWPRLKTALISLTSSQSSTLRPATLTGASTT